MLKFSGCSRLIRGRGHGCRRLAVVGKASERHDAKVERLAARPKVDLSPRRAPRTGSHVTASHRPQLRRGHVACNAILTEAREGRAGISTRIHETWDDGETPARQAPLEPAPKGARRELAQPSSAECGDRGEKRTASSTSTVPHGEHTRDSTRNTIEHGATGKSGAVQQTSRENADQLFDPSPQTRNCGERAARNSRPERETEAARPSTRRPRVAGRRGESDATSPPPGCIAATLR
jgi:hypothetical protein